MDLIRATNEGDLEKLITTSRNFSDRGIPKWEQIFDPNSTSQISTISRNLGRKEVTKFIYIQLARLNNFFNVARPMSQDQMKELSLEIAIKMWHLKLEEIDVIMEGIKNNRWGQIYERLDPSIIWEQINLYEQARTEHLENTAMEHKTTEIKLETEGDRIGRGIATSVGAILSSQDAIKKKG